MTTATELCLACGTPMRVVGDAEEGTMYYESVATAVRRELLDEIDKALRSDGAAMHHSSCWRNAGFGEACGPADYRTAEYMADFIAQRFKP